MARKQPTQAFPAAKLVLTAAQIEKGLARLSDRIVELEAFDRQSIRNGGTPELQALEVRIQDTLLRCFGEGTSGLSQYSPATRLDYRPMFALGDSYVDYATPIDRNIRESIALLRQAQHSLNEDLTDLVDLSTGVASPPSIQSTPAIHPRRIFVVHGHDEGARETLARFLEKIGFEAIILHEQANQGRTVIEKIEGHSEVGFAVVLLTPDDVGSANGGALQPRARQNVMLELGYFLGRLGRERVCALKRGKLEIPSDFAGVVWQSMDDSGWKQALGRELEAAGFDIDWNKVMKA